MEHESFSGKASLLTLPIESRFMIYDLVINPTGTLVIFAQYELSKCVDAETIRLLHVNRLIRAEIHEYFYKNQNFEFRSFPAMERFLDSIGTYYASIIRNVVIGSWLAQRANFAEKFAPLVEKLTGIERLTILPPAHGFVTDWSDQAEMGDKAIAVINASERLRAGKFHLAWVDFHGRGVMQFTAPNIQEPWKDESAFRKLVMGILVYGHSRWQRADFVHFIQVRGPNCLPETSGNENENEDSPREVNITSIQISETEHFIYNDDSDDADL